jgi:hypothetical protein
VCPTAPCPTRSADGRAAPGVGSKHQETRTSAFPRFSPFSIPMNARGAFSKSSVTSRGSAGRGSSS